MEENRGRTVGFAATAKREQMLDLGGVGYFSQRLNTGRRHREEDQFVANPHELHLLTSVERGATQQLDSFLRQNAGTGWRKLFRAPHNDEEHAEYGAKTADDGNDGARGGRRSGAIDTVAAGVTARGEAERRFLIRRGNCLLARNQPHVERRLTNRLLRICRGLRGICTLIQRPGFEHPASGKGSRLIDGDGRDLLGRVWIGILSERRRYGERTEDVGYPENFCS
jgi:hypothetical protein